MSSASVPLFAGLYQLGGLCTIDGLARRIRGSTQAGQPQCAKPLDVLYSEVMEVKLAQIEEAGVSRFECPTCLAVRDIPPKGDRVKFPWHPKRTTNTPNHCLRWAKGESAWRISD
jgi:hypothetical protein